MDLKNILEGHDPSNNLHAMLMGPMECVECKSAVFYGDDGMFECACQTSSWRQALDVDNVPTSPSGYRQVRIVHAMADGTVEWMKRDHGIEFPPK